MAWIFKGNIKGPPGKSIRGLPGPSGLNGTKGRDGKDAPQIIDIELEGDDESFYLVFYFSDGSSIETNTIEIPKLKEEINNYFTAAASASKTETVDKATKLVLERVASENIDANDIVRLDSATTAAKASIDTYTNSKAVGVALDTVTTGQTLRILVSGIHEDASYTFTVNEPLFLQSDSSLSQTAPSATGEFVARIGESLGVGAIFIRIDEPMEIV